MVHPTAFTDLPREIFHEIQKFNDRPAANSLNQVNNSIHRMLNQTDPFQFNQTQLNTAFRRKKNKVSFIRHPEFLSYRNGVFKIKHLNIIQRFFRRYFKSYKSTHMQTLRYGCNFFAFQSKGKIICDRDRTSLFRLSIKIDGKTDSLDAIMKGKKYNNYTLVQNNLNINIDGKAFIGSLRVKRYITESIFRFTLDDTQEYVEFQVSDPSQIYFYKLEENKQSRKPMQLTYSFVRGHAPNGGNLQDADKSEKLSKVAYQIAQIIAKQGKVDLFIKQKDPSPEDGFPPSVRPAHFPTVLQDQNFKLKKIENELGGDDSYWYWNHENNLANLPNINVNLEFDF